MSSLRNAVQRRPHRERAQPLERRRLGLLEKHKDYALRAKDFNKKKKTLKNLREKAADRNEDEFYFAMMSRKGPSSSRLMGGKNWSGTVQGDRGNKAMDVDTVRLLKTQDIGYVRTMRQVVAKEVAKLEEQIVLTRGFDKLDEEEEMEADEDEDDDDEFDFATAPSKPKAPRKIVFIDDEDEREATIQDQMDEDEDGENPQTQDDERAESLRRLRRQLENARKKLKGLTDVENELEVQRAKMAKTATSGGYTRKGKKIMVRTRKR